VPDDLDAFFLTPQTAKQRQYEALRAYVLEGLSAKAAAERFGFTEATLYTLAHRLRCGQLELFPAAIQSVLPILSEREQGSHPGRTYPVLLHHHPCHWVDVEEAGSNLDCGVGVGFTS